MGLTRREVSELKVLAQLHPERWRQIKARQHLLDDLVERGFVQRSRRANPREFFQDRGNQRFFEVTAEMLKSTLPLRLAQSGETPPEVQEMYSLSDAGVKHLQDLRSRAGRIAKTFLRKRFR